MRGVGDTLHYFEFNNTSLSELPIPFLRLANIHQLYAGNPIIYVTVDDDEAN